MNLLLSIESNLFWIHLNSDSWIEPCIFSVFKRIGTKEFFQPKQEYLENSLEQLKADWGVT